MSASPSPYNPQYNFTLFQENNPNTPLPATQIDNELANIATSINETETRLALIQDDDGGLRGGIVTLSSLSPEVAGLLSSANFNYRGLWVTNTFYAYKDFWTDPVSKLTYVTVATNGYTSAASIATDIVSANVAQFSANTQSLVSGQFSVADYGAIGDGINDDYPAILAAYSALVAAGSGTLVFPANATYRVGTAGVTGIHINQQSNVTISMGQNSMMLMDNMVAGDAVSHGIFVQGPCTNITFNNVHVKYSSISTDRQVFAPFYFLGANVGTGDNSSPNGWVRGSSDGTENPAGIQAGAVTNIIMRDCTSENSPSVFCGIVGVDGLYNENFHGINSWADGLYHLYFRNCKHVGVTLENAGDDAISMASYESDIANSNIENDFHGEGSSVVNAFIVGQYPSVGFVPCGSVVLLGSRDVCFTNINIKDRYRAIRFESGTEFGPETTFANLNLNMLASQNCLIHGITADNVTQAISFTSKEINLASDTKWWMASVTIEQVSILANPSGALGGSSPVDVFSSGPVAQRFIAGYHFKNIRCLNCSNPNNSIGPIYSCTFEDVEFNFVANFIGLVPYSIDPDTVDGSGNPVFHDSLCGFTNIKGSDLQFQGFKRCSLENVQSTNANLIGINISTCADLQIGRLIVKLANRTGAATQSAVFIDQFCKRIVADTIDVEHDNITLSNALSIDSTNLNRIALVKVKTTLNTQYRMVSDAQFSYPDNTRVSQIKRIEWCNQGAASPNNNWKYLDFPDSLVGIQVDADFDIFTIAAPVLYVLDTPLTANRTVTVHEDSTAIGQQVVVTRRAGATGAFNLIFQGLAEVDSPIGERTALGSFLVTPNAAPNGTAAFSQVSVNGVNLLSAPVPWSTDYLTTAAAVAASIKGGHGTHGFNANAYQNAVSIQAPTGSGATLNGIPVVVTVAGNAGYTNATDMEGGAAAITPATPTPYAMFTTTNVEGFVVLEYAGTSDGWKKLYGTL